MAKPRPVDSKSTPNQQHLSNSDLGGSPAVQLERSVVRDAKSKVIAIEKTNFSSLILWRSTSNWWKMCEHSALIYAHHVAPTILGKKEAVTINIDGDRYYNSRVGTVSIPNISKFTEQLAAKGIKKSQKSTDLIYIYTLPKPLDENAIAHFKALEAGRREKMNKFIGITNKFPFLNDEIRKSTGVIFNVVKKFDQPRMLFVGNRILDEIHLINLAVTRLERGSITIEEGLKEIAFRTDTLMNSFRLVYELNFANMEKIEGIVKHLHNISTALGAEFRKLDEAKAKEAKEAEKAAKKEEQK